MPDDYCFDIESLAPHRRCDGISAFMRIRNGEEFLRLTIESHIDYFDEIVACYNQCTDRTVDILGELQETYPDKLRVHHYEPRVYPLGSPAHQQASAVSIHSMANYSNWALSKTRCRIAVKLDDDHLAIRSLWPRAIDIVRSTSKPTAWCFSGLNVLKQADVAVGVYANKPLAGNRDIFFFNVSQQTHFIQGPNGERFANHGLPRRYLGMLFFHLKHLKANFGFDNYELEQHPDSLRAKQVRDFHDHARWQSLDGFLRMSPMDLYRLTRRRGIVKNLRFALARCAPHIERMLPFEDFYIARSMRCANELRSIDFDEALFKPLRRCGV